MTSPLFENGIPATDATHILENMPFPVLCMSKDCEILYYNSSFATFIGKSVEKPPLTIGALFPKFQPCGLTSKTALQKFFQESHTKGAQQSPWTILDNNACEILTQFTVSAISQDENSPFILYVHHELPCKSCKKEAQKTQQFINNILNTLPMTMHLWSKELELIDCSSAVIDMFQVQSKEEYIENFLKFSPQYQVDGLSEELFKEYLEKAFTDGLYKFQWLNQDITGKIFPTEETLCRVQFQGENFVLGYTQDNSAVTEGIKNIIHMEERTRAILDATPMAIHLWDKNFKIRDTNLESLRLYNYEDKQEFLNDFWQTVPKYQPNGDISEEVLNNALTIAFEHGHHHIPTLYCLTKEGDMLPLELTTIRIVIRDEIMTIAYLRDLREITAFINKIQESEERAQAILDLSPHGINVWNKDMHLVDCNKAIVRLYGYQNSEEYVTNRYNVLPEKQSDGSNSVELAVQKIQEAFAIGNSNIEAMTKDVHGNLIPVDIELKRALLADEEVVIGYVQDLREFKAILAEIHAVEQDLRSARDVAVQSARAKSEFLANMSHEIRTPLNGVLGLLHILESTDLHETQKDYVKKTIFSAENLLRIINDILDFSKIDAGKMEMESIPFALEDVASELKLLFEPQANAKNLALTFKYDSCIKQVLLGDPLRIKQIFFNLIGNAIKFTEKGGVTISMKGKEKSPNSIECLFSVRDSGIGMDEEQCSRLFSAFMQADTSFTRKYGGTGLGLVIARRISNLMHGDLWVESVEGEGSTFFFSAIFEYASADEQLLPMFTMDAMDMMQADRSDAAHKEELTTPQTASGAQANAEKTKESSLNATPTLAEEHPALHILLVEDNEINQLIAEELLKNVGHTVDIANNGQEALDLLHKNTYNIVLMDIQMPIMDGLTTVGKIRETPALAHMPVIAMSAHAMTGDREISLHHGMNEHITKPISPNILYDTVNTWALK